MTISARLVAGVFAAALTLSSAAHAAEDKIKMTIGYQSLWAGVGEIYEVLRNTNVLELNGIEADFKTFTFGGPLAEAAVAGEIDNVLGADAPVLRAAARKDGIVVVNRSHDWRWGILVREGHDAQELADLRGARMAAPFATTTFPRAMRQIVSAGLTDPFRDMSIFNQDIAEQAAAMQGGHVDVVATWDPTMSRLIDAGLARPLYISEDGEALGWQALNSDFLEKYGEDGAVRYLKAWIMATWWASNNVEQAQAWFAETSRIPTNLLKAAQDADRHLRAPVADVAAIDYTISDTEIADAQSVMDFLREHNLLREEIDVAKYVDMRYLNRAQDEIRAGDHPPLDAIEVRR